jgi:hypothetical protein
VGRGSSGEGAVADVLDRLDAGEDTAWMEMSSGPSIFIQLTGERDCPEAVVEDEGGSMVTVRVPLVPPDDWIADHCQRLRGRRRYTEQSHFSSNHRYSAATYEESTGATLAGLRAAPGTVTRRLLGPLLRSLDSEEMFAKALTDEG